MKTYKVELLVRVRKLVSVEVRANNKDEAIEQAINSAIDNEGSLAFRGFEEGDPAGQVTLFKSVEEINEEERLLC
jgi:hypothetical protein